MSFENFQLDTNIISELYKDSVFILEESQVKQPSLDADSYKFLGGFGKRILILVADDQNTWLSDTDMNLLTAILGACKFNMNDVAITNIKRLSGISIDSHIESMKPSQMILFGDIQTGLTAKSQSLFTIQQSAGFQWLGSPSLAALAQQPEAKKALWISLKNMFAI